MNLTQDTVPTITTLGYAQSGSFCLLTTLTKQQIIIHV